MRRDLFTPEIEARILEIRDQKVLLDRDLATLYGVSTKRLNQRVNRNRERFPKDFVFQLNDDERSEVVANCNHLKSLKFSPKNLSPSPNTALSWRPASSIRRARLKSAFLWFAPSSSSANGRSRTRKSLRN